MDIKDFGKLNYLGINNLRSIDLISMDLDGENFVPITGPNGSGKSTVMDSMVMLFNGGSIPDSIIKDGGDNAEIQIKTDSGISITKRIRKNKKGKQVTDIVMQKDNQVISKPQNILKELFGGFITPNDIAMATGAALYKKIVSSAGISFANEEKEIDDIKSKISEKNVLIKNIGEIVEPECEEPDVVVYNREEHTKVQDRIKVINSHKTSFDGFATATALFEEEVEKKRKELQDMEAQLAEKKTKADKLRTALTPELKELDDLNLQNIGFNKSLDLKEDADKWRIFHDKKSEKNDLEAEKRSLENKLKNASTKLTKLYSSAETGVPGLNITETKDVLLNGLPWANACFSDRIKSAAILSMNSADKSKLPIMFVEHGESLSVAKRNEIAKVAIERGAIVFMEVFMEDTTGVNEGIVLQLPEKPYIPAENAADDIPKEEMIPKAEDPEMALTDLGMKKGGDIFKESMIDEIEIVEPETEEIDWDSVL